MRAPLIPLLSATALCLGQTGKLEAQTFPHQIPFQFAQVPLQMTPTPPFANPVDLLSNPIARRIERARAWSAHRLGNPAYILDSQEQDKPTSTPPDNFIFDPYSGRWFVLQELEP